MKKTAISFALILVAACLSGGQAQAAEANSPTAQSDKDSADNKSDQKATANSSPEPTKKKKHEKRTASKPRKADGPDGDANTRGDGSPVTKLGSHKRVDGGFDFENSKTFHQTGN